MRRIMVAMALCACGGTSPQWTRDPHFLAGKWDALWTFGAAHRLNVDFVFVMDSAMPAPVPVSGTFLIHDGNNLICNGQLSGTAQINGATLALDPSAPERLPILCDKAFSLFISTPPLVMDATITGYMFKDGQLNGDQLVFHRE